MAVERFIEFENGLCIRWSGNRFDPFAAGKRAGSPVKLIRDLWDSVEEFEEYKKKEQGIDRNTE